MTKVGCILDFFFNLQYKLTRYTNKNMNGTNFDIDDTNLINISLKFFVLFFKKCLVSLTFSLKFINCFLVFSMTVTKRQAFRKIFE